MSGPDRYRDAEVLLAAYRTVNDAEHRDPQALAEAQVQATLALAAATALPLIVQHFGDSDEVAEWARAVAPDVFEHAPERRESDPEGAAALPVEFADGYGSMWTYRGADGEPLFNLRVSVAGDGGRNVTLTLDEAERLFVAGLNTVRAIRKPLPGGQP